MVAVWVAGSAALLAAGFAAALVPPLRARRRARQVAWSAARAAIESAAVSRDAASRPVPAAEELLTRAELLSGQRGGPAAARAVAGYAREADRMWRGAVGD